MNNERRKRIEALAESLSALKVAFEDVRDEEQEAFDAIPEALQDSDNAQKSQAAIDNLDSVVSDLENAGYLLEEAIE